MLKSRALLYTRGCACMHPMADGVLWDDIMARGHYYHITIYMLLRLARTAI